MINGTWLTLTLGQAKGNQGNSVPAAALFVITSVNSSVPK